MASPSVLTDDYGALLTTTLRNMQPRLRDNISRGNRFLAWLNMRGRTRTTDGGERIQVALMHAQNSTADIYAGYGLLNTTPQEGITSAFFDWAQLSVSIAISRKEERQNSGQSRILALLEAKTTQAEVSVKELLNNCIVAGRITASTAAGQFLARIGALDSGATGPLPLGALIDYTPSRSVTIGNINGNTYSFWRNQAKVSAATTYAGMRTEMDNLYNTCSRGQGGSPDLIISDQQYWETYHMGLQNQERYVVSDQRVIDVLGGSDALKFRGATIIWDEVVPDVATNAEVVSGVGTFLKSTAYFINSETWEFITDGETDFITTPFVRPQDQDAKVAQILWMGATAVNNRRKNGVHGNVSLTITS
jgi:hypothetical protein